TARAARTSESSRRPAERRKEASTPSRLRSRARALRDREQETAPLRRLHGIHRSWRRKAALWRWACRRKLFPFPSPCPHAAPSGSRNVSQHLYDKGDRHGHGHNELHDDGAEGPEQAAPAGPQRLFQRSAREQLADERAEKRPEKEPYRQEEESCHGAEHRPQRAGVAGAEPFRSP